MGNIERHTPGAEAEPKKEIREWEAIHPEEFPKNPEEWLGAALADFANNENKAITLLLLEKAPKGQGELWREFLEVTDNCWEVGRSVPKDYCVENLVPIWAAGEGPPISFRITEAGKHYGQPIAAFLLKKAVEYGHSFYPIFGSTQSSGESRAPFNRAKILETIVQSPSPLRAIDIADSLGLPVGNHLCALSEAGLIRYTSANLEESGFALYQWRPEAELEEVEPVSRFSWLTPQVAQILAQEKGMMSRGDIQRALQELFPGKIFAKPTISTILCGLHEQGLVSAQFQGGKKQSEIELLDRGRQIYQEVILPIKDTFNDGPALEEMRAFLPGWSDFAPKATSLYKEISPAARRKPSSDWQAEILSLLDSEGLRPTDVHRALGSLSLSRVSFYLSYLYHQALVVRKREGRAVRYSLVENHEKG